MEKASDLAAAVQFNAFFLEPPDAQHLAQKNLSVFSSVFGLVRFDSSAH
jgi:hypothetical protein